MNHFVIEMNRFVLLGMNLGNLSLQHIIDQKIHFDISNIVVLELRFLTPRRKTGGKKRGSEDSCLSRRSSDRPPVVS